MTAPKRKKSDKPPLAMQWHKALRQWPHHWDSPGKAVIVAVAIVVADFGSSSHESYPAIETIMLETGSTKRSVRSALRQLVEEGWLAVLAEAVPWHRPTTYGLRFPMGAPEHPYDETSMGARRGARTGAYKHPDLLPPTVREEEEESASAPLPDGRVAALPPKPTTDPFDDDPFLSSVAPINAKLKAICAEIATRARVSIDARTLAPALDATMRRLGWSADEAAVYAVEKLKRMGNKVHRPAAFLATDLSQLDRDLTPSPRMALARVLSQLDELDERAEEAADARGDERFDSPFERLEHALVDAELIGNDDEGMPLGMPSMWDITAVNVEKFTQIAQTVIREFNKTRRDR